MAGGIDDLIGGEKKDDFDTLLSDPNITVATRAIDAPTVFADGLYHIHTVNGVARLAFMQTVAEPLDTPEGDKGYQAKHVAIVALPITQLRSVAAYLTQTIENFEAAGLLPPAQ